MTGAKSTELVLPNTIECYRLNRDGSYEEAIGVSPNFYILDTQVFKIWDINIQKILREKFGCIVGVMHKDVDVPEAPAHRTFKYILGG